MNSSRVYYGGTVFSKEDLLEANNFNKVRLEYYYTRISKLEEDAEKYGIEVVKKEYADKDVKIEKKKIDNVSENAKKVINIIETLKKYKVTPIGLQDVVEDLLKGEEDS